MSCKCELGWKKHFNQCLGFHGFRTSYYHLKALSIWALASSLHTLCPVAFVHYILVSKEFCSFSNVATLFYLQTLVFAVPHACKVFLPIICLINCTNPVDWNVLFKAWFYVFLIQGRFFLSHRNLFFSNDNTFQNLQEQNDAFIYLLNTSVHPYTERSSGKDLSS